MYIVDSPRRYASFHRQVNAKQTNAAPTRGSAVGHRDNFEFKIVLCKRLTNAISKNNNSS